VFEESGALADMYRKFAPDILLSHWTLEMKPQRCINHGHLAGQFEVMFDYFVFATKSVVVLFVKKPRGADSAR
jgi:hypothetical protein